METGSQQRSNGRLGLLAVIGVVLLLRLPFLNQAIQGDDIYYLFGAQHALIDPAHPSHARYVFTGDVVDMRGHPHPPLNSWMLACLLAIFGDVYEIPFHSAYLLFSLIAAVAVWFLAVRFAPHPLWATLLFCVTPAFVVNGNSLESDIPFVAFWLAALALFTYGRIFLSAIAMLLAAMTAYQAVVLTPVLWAYLWFAKDRKPGHWIATLTPLATVAVYQLYERLTSGALPATVLAGYFSSYGLQQLANKLKNAAALTAHAGWLVFPLAAWAVTRSTWWIGLAAALAGLLIDWNPLFWVPFAIGVQLLAYCVRRRDWLSAWVLIFFAAALVLFFAGSARYLLPIACPVAILLARERSWAMIGFVLQLPLSIGLSWVNFDHWDGYRQIAQRFKDEATTKRIWVNGEWGLRFYFESLGALPLERGGMVQPGDLLVTSALGYPLKVTAPLAKVAEHDVTATLPLRLIGLGAKSGYSTASLGFRPFDIQPGPIDRVTIESVLERRPTLSFLPMTAPEAQQQIVTGLYDLEGQTRWMAGRAIVLLKPPAQPLPLHVKVYIADLAPARQISIDLDGKRIAGQTFPSTGMHTLSTPPVTGSTVEIRVDKTFSVPGDSRVLGVVLVEAGFR